jgi:nicotinamide-nucleotide amidase
MIVAKRIESIVARSLSKSGLTLAVAESCTGGLVGHRITQTPGSSNYFFGGVIAYSNFAKVRLLGVGERTLTEHGAVSRETASEMAEGARRLFGTDIALSVTGIAGPGGERKQKPVGLVYIALAIRGTVVTKRKYFTGTRNAIKARASTAALSLLCQYLCACKQ